MRAAHSRPRPRPLPVPFGVSRVNRVRMTVSGVRVWIRF